MDSNYRYRILPGISKNSEDIGLYNLLFDRWKELWVEVFSQVGRADEINVDDFYKQSLIATITKDNSPIGLHLYSFYDLRLSAAREQAYFAGLPVEVLSFFESQGILRIMTMEYLTIFPEYRASLEGIRWAEVMISLGTRLLAYAPCDYAIGTARQDV